MRISSAVFFAILFCASPLFAEVAPVDVSVSKEEAWTGEKVSIYVELRAKGSFSGSAAFDLPETPRSLLIKVGNPVVGSRKIEGESWFTQRHEFALFSQKTGAVEIPSFPVRFEARDGFTGPVREVVAKTDAISVTIKRPPGSERIPFLVTTTEFTVEESWDPVRGEGATVGDVFRRTIVQRAVNLTGMALLPTSTGAPDGVRVYPPRVETNDKTERGAFDGERRETLTYLLQEDGVVTLPELTYTWWNPKSETLQSKSLSAVTMQVAPVPVTEVLKSTGVSRSLPVWLAGLGLLCLVAWKYRGIESLIRRVWRWIDPPERVASRHLRRACRHDRVAPAAAAWNEWVSEAGPEFQPSPELRAAVVEMQSMIFGRETQGSWDGSNFLQMFARERALRKSVFKRDCPEVLPSLNSPKGSVKSP